MVVTTLDNASVTSVMLLFARTLPSGATAAAGGNFDVLWWIGCFFTVTSSPGMLKKGRFHTSFLTLCFGDFLLSVWGTEAS